MKRKKKKQPEKPAGRYDYSSRFRAVAKECFLKSRTATGTIRLLKAKGYKDPPHINTIRQWRDEEGWKDDLDRIDRMMTGELDPDAEDFDKLAHLIQLHRRNLQADFEKFRTKKGKEAMTANELTQFSHAINRAFVAEATILAKKKEAERAMSQETPVPVIFAALKKHPRIGPLLLKAEVLAELEQLLGEEMLEYQKKAVGL